MKVGELKEFIKNLPDDMEIVIDDTFNRGVSPTYPLKVEERVWDDTYYKEDEKRTPEKCLIISIDTKINIFLGTDKSFVTKDTYDKLFKDLSYIKNI